MFGSPERYVELGKGRLRRGEDIGKAPSAKHIRTRCKRARELCIQSLVVDQYKHRINIHLQVVETARDRFQEGDWCNTVFFCSKA